MMVMMVMMVAMRVLLAAAVAVVVGMMTAGMVVMLVVVVMMPTCAHMYVRSPSATQVEARQKTVRNMNPHRGFAFRSGASAPRSSRSKKRKHE